MIPPFFWVLFCGIAGNISGQIGSRAGWSRNYAARALMLEGVEEVADAVKVTVGPKAQKIHCSFLHILQLLQAAVSKEDTVIFDGAADQKAMKERCDQIRSAIESSTSDSDKEKLKGPAKLSGGVAVSRCQCIQ